MLNGQGPSQPPVQRGSATALVDDSHPVRHLAPASPETRLERARTSISNLFPHPTGVLTTRGGLWIALAAVLVGTGVSLLRTTGTGPLQSIWEEDARDILTDAINLPTAKAIVKPIAGYYVLFPRLLGELTTLFPVSWAAAVLSISAAIVVALLAVQVYVAAGAHFSNPLARFLVSAPLLAAPTAENFLSEIYNRPVGLHFFAAYALFWLLLWTPSSRLGKAGLLTTVGMTAFSSILIIGYVPLALVRLYVKRDRLSLVATILILAGTATQLSSVAAGVHGRVGHPKLDPIWTVATYLFWEVPNSLFGYRATSGLTLKYPSVTDGIRHEPFIVLVSLAIPIIVVIVAIIGSRRGLLRPQWLLAGLAAAYSVWLHVFTASANGDIAMRYVLPIELLLLSSMVLLLLPAKKLAFPTSLHWRKSGALLTGFAVFVLVVCAFNYRWNDTYRHNAPQWTDQIRQAAAECQHNQALGTVMVRGAPLPWWSTVPVPCHELWGTAGCAVPVCEYLDPPKSLGPPPVVAWARP